jgi:hypothetical protein
LITAGLPYTFAWQARLDEVTGRSPQGASTIAGNDGRRSPSENEMAGARFQGRYVAEIASKLSHYSSFFCSVETGMNLYVHTRTMKIDKTHSLLWAAKTEMILGLKPVVETSPSRTPECV